MLCSEYASRIKPLGPALLAARTGLVLALASALASAALSAQDTAGYYPQRRDGFWASVGLGYGRLDFRCGGGTSIGDDSPEPETCPEAGQARATTAFVRVGYALTQQLLVSVTVDAWKRVGSGDAARDLGAAVRVYPVRSRGLFVELGAGRSVFRVHGFDGPDEVGRGVGMVAGLGWDLRVDRNMSLTPVALFHYGYQGDTGMPFVIVFPDGSKDALRTRVHETLVTFGFALTFH